MQTYSNPSRADDLYALPDVEVFYIGEQDPDFQTEDGEYSPEGWYYWFCFPGCLPDSEPYGPFETAELAELDAQEQAELDGEGE